MSFTLLRKIWQFCRAWRTDLRAAAAKYFVTREVVKVLALTHAQELADTPRNEWRMVRQRQIEEIQAVRDGKQFDIVDRRSWGYPYIPECCDNQTETLTKRGWLHWSEVKLDDLLASRSPEGLLTYQKPTRLIKKWYSGTMYNFETTGVDICVTPNHDMYGQRQYHTNGVDWEKDKGHLRFISAQRIYDEMNVGHAWKEFYAPVTSTWEGIKPKSHIVEIKATKISKYGHAENYRVDLEDWLRFLGIYIAEGSHEGAHVGMNRCEKGHKPIWIQAIAAAADHIALVKRNRGAEHNKFNQYRVRLTQKKPEGVKAIKALLKRLPFGFSQSGSEFGCGCKALWEAVAPLGNSHTKYVPQWIKELPASYIKIFLRWAMKGDGSTYYGNWPGYVKRKGDPSCWEYTTVSEQLANDMCELLQKISRPATLSTRVLDDGCIAYRIYSGVKKTIGIGRPIPIQYKGYVYCAEVPPYHTLLVRRHGRAAWVGNSLHRLNQPI